VGKPALYHSAASAAWFGNLAISAHYGGFFPALLDSLAQRLERTFNDSIMKWPNHTPVKL
jgi:hypothetical protein